eukprot:COSAG02_NODE_13633_length_1369_cov_1.414961_2_plen_131_part_00
MPLPCPTLFKRNKCNVVNVQEILVPQWKRSLQLKIREPPVSPASEQLVSFETPVIHCLLFICLWVGHCLTDTGFTQAFEHALTIDWLPGNSWLEAAQNTLAVEQAVDVLLAQCATLSAYHLIDVDTESNL